MKLKTFELAAFNIEDAISGATLGADRIELCKDYTTGGLTPDVHEVKLFKQRFEKSIFVMISPKANDYSYGKDFDKLGFIKSIYSFHEAGVDGFVFGAVMKNDSNEIVIDLEISRLLIENAEGLSCTFHRAFDIIDDQETAIDQIIEMGYKRILTSGNPGKAVDHFEKLLALKNYSNGRITIVPGGGLRANNIQPFLEAGFDELHSACVKSDFQLDEEEIKMFAQKLK